MTDAAVRRVRHAATKWFLLGVVLVSGAAGAHAQTRPGAQVVKACWAQGGSHADAIRCEAKERDRLNAEMLRRYESGKEAMRQSDHDMKAADSLALVEREKILIKSQEAFDHYKEAECQRAVDAAMGGTSGADFALGCEIDLITQRIERLDHDSKRDETGTR